MLSILAIHPELTSAKLLSCVQMKCFSNFGLDEGFESVLRLCGTILSNLCFYITLLISEPDTFICDTSAMVSMQALMCNVYAPNQ